MERTHAMGRRPKRMETAYQLYIQWAAVLMRASPVLQERGLKQDYESGGKRWP
jgi:hypothetical protein